MKHCGFLNSSSMALAICLMLGSAAVNAGSITLDTIIRDFSKTHDDFEGAIGGSGFTTGLVGTTLGLDGKPVYIGGNTMSTEANFDEWYNDTPGVNHTFTSSLTATETSPGSGVFTYSSGSYFPINGLGFGNEGFVANYHFTTQINTEFTYTGFGAGADFTFSGDDDVWVFVNDELVIDLGGIHGAVTGSSDIDSLGLTLGETYSLDIFHAERQTSGSNFSFTTAATLVTVPVPAPAALWLLLIGLAGLVFRLRPSGLASA